MDFGKVLCVTLKRKAEFRGCLFTISAHASPLRLNLEGTCFCLFSCLEEELCTQSYRKKILQINNPPIIELLRKDILPGSWKLLDLVLSHALA